MRVLEEKFKIKDLKKEKIKSKAETGNKITTKSKERENRKNKHTKHTEKSIKQKKERRRKSPISGIRGNIISYFTNIKRIIREYYEQPVTKLDNSDDKWKISNVLKNWICSLNSHPIKLQDLLPNSKKYLRKYPIYINYSDFDKEESFPTHFMKLVLALSWYQKVPKILQENYRPIVLMHRGKISK